MENNTKIIDLAIVKDENSIIDFVFQNGGLKLTTSLLPSINAVLNTNNQIIDFTFGSREGSAGVTFGSGIWSILKHSRLDKQTINTLISEVSLSLNVFKDKGYWDKHSVELREKTSEKITLMITTYSGINTKNYFIDLSTGV